MQFDQLSASAAASGREAPFHFIRGMHKLPVTHLELAAHDLPARRPAWEALADLFLDTDVSLSREWRIRQLAQSPYSIEELEAILMDEVYPVCGYNLLSLAGEWSGFDPAWLEDRILRRTKSTFRLLQFLNPGRLAVRLSLEWRATKAGILDARGLRCKGLPQARP